MQQLIELNDTEIMLAFAASCIEGTARRLGINYYEVFTRMKNVGLIDKYIIPFYDVLHLESREHVIDNVIEALNIWETKR